MKSLNDFAFCAYKLGEQIETKIVNLRILSWRLQARQDNLGFSFYEVPYAINLVAEE